MRQAVKVRQEAEACVRPSAANNLHQSQPIILYDIHLWPNRSNSSIDARLTIDIEPRRRLSLKMKPFEYRGIEHYITFNHWLVVAVPRDLFTSEQEPGSQIGRAHV